MLLLRVNAQFVIAPDNGTVSLLTQKHQPDWVRQLRNSRYFQRQVAATFHGRDIMGPVAAHLCRGVAPEEFGPLVDDFVQLDWKRVELDVANRQMVGQVVAVDSFGNLITNVEQSLLQRLGVPREVRVFVGQTLVASRLVRSYAESPQDSLVALIGSLGQLEIALVNGNAAAELATGEGQSVRLNW